MNSRRQERLAALYQKTIAAYLQKELRLEKGIMVVTKVELSKKLDHLWVYYSVWPDPEEKNVLKFLENLKPELKGHLADKIKTKFLPEMEFRLDESEKKRLKIEDLLKKTK
ncbi:MAG: 30S ribosome-binding factor RbfA [Patescibacteria group bacterium]|mgnify:CR=1 FL=1